MANFITGSFIEVLYTDNTVARFPEHIGCIGIVDHAPIHPSTWFTIKMMDGRSIKLQTTAMKHVAKNDSRHQVVQNILSLPAQKPHTATHAATADVPKENHRPRSNSNIGISHFTKGVSVVILRTDNVLHRVPHLVGVVGTIKEVPVHPITWFKIEFPSGQVATFRPSAFKLNDGKDEELPRPSKKPTAFSASLNHMYAKKVPTKERDRSNDYEYTVGMQVSIRSGELSGETGEVLKSSNGWIQVLTPLGRVAKRAHELDYSSCSTTPRSDTSRESLTIEQAEYLRMRPNFDLTNRCDQNGLKALKKAVFMSLHKDITALGPKSPLKGENYKRKFIDTSSLGVVIAPLYDLERQSVDCPFPLIPLHLRQAKRKRLQEYVDSECEATQRRPDLSYWLQEIKGSFRSKDVYESDIYEATPLVSVVPSRTTSFSAPPPVEVLPSKVEVVEAIHASHDRCESPTQSEEMTPMDRVVRTPIVISVMPSLPIIAVDAEAELHFKSLRDRSSSIAETDCEETFSPELSPRDREVPNPSPLTLPLVGSDSAAQYLALDEFYKTKSTVNIIQDDAVEEICDSTVDINTVSRAFTFANKSTFSAIPNPIKLFLPRHYSSRSCPTFSPFQTSSFSPFTSYSQTQPTRKEWQDFFTTEKSCHMGNASPFLNSAFLPFTSPTSTDAITESN